MSKLYFKIFVDRPNDAKRDGPEDAIGYFACMPATAKFLDIVAKGGTKDAIMSEVKASAGRTITRVDGSKIQEEAKVGVAGHQRMLALPDSKGAKRVTILTGNKIADSQAVNKANAYHTISFSFPTFCSNLIISQALGRTIPANKISKDGTPSEADIHGWFRSPGGKRYPIILLGSGTPDAEQPKVAVGDEITDAQMAMVETKKGGKKKKAAQA